MTETLLSYDVGSSPLRPQPPPSFEAQLKAIPACGVVCSGVAISDKDKGKKKGSGTKKD